jgi:acyl-coenzyme A thioesterase PaaI-like protein
MSESEARSPFSFRPRPGAPASAEAAIAETGEGVDLEWVDEQLGPDPGWTSLVRLARMEFAPGKEPGRFVPTWANAGVALRCYRREADGMVVGKAFFGPAAGGPPGFAHGGAHMAVLDHAFGAAAWTSGYPVVTASMTYDFRRGIPIGSIVLVEAEIESVAGRKVRVRGRLCDREGKSYGEGHALFLTMSSEQVRGATLASPEAATGDVVSAEEESSG